MSGTKVKVSGKRREEGEVLLAQDLTIEVNGQVVNWTSFNMDVGTHQVVPIITIRFFPDEIEIDTGA